MKRRPLRIVKINAQKSPQYRQEFVAQPINYLKIIENKDKIKYEYLNKDFDPRTDLKQLAGRRLEYPNPDVDPMSAPIPPTTTSQPSSPVQSHPHIPSPPPPQQQQQPSSMPPTPTATPTRTPPGLRSGFTGEYMFEIPVDSDDDEPFHRPSTTPPPHQPQPQPFLRDSPSTHHVNATAPADSTIVDTPYKYDLRTPPPSQRTSASTSQDRDRQHAKLRDFLMNSSDREDDNGDEESRYYSRQKTYAPPKPSVVNPYSYMSESQKAFSMHDKGPPTLDELQKRGEYEPKQEYMDVHKMDEMLRATAAAAATTAAGIASARASPSPSPPQSRSRSHHSDSNKGSPSHLSPPPPPSPLRVDSIESIDDRKRELLMKLDMLRKKYPESSHSIPFMSIATPLKELEFVYQSELRKLEIDSSVGDYRMYLIGMFMFTEFILGRFLRLDLEGFTQQQMLSMTRYDRFLIEIGEKNFVPEGKRWPVEVRLAGFVVIQAAAFTVSKMILHRTGTNLMGMFNAHVHSHRPQPGGPQPPPRKMKMPDVDLDDT